MKTRSLYLFTVTLTLLLCGVALQSEGFTAPKRGWLGVSIREMTPSMRSEYELGGRIGLLITDVLPGSPADDAGLREDDVIIKYDGRQVERADEFSDMVRNTAPDTKVQLTIMRDGEEKNLEVEIGRKRRRMPGFFGWTGDGHHSMFFTNRVHLGVQVQALNADLASYFGLEEGDGVLVVEVMEDTPAMRAGLKSGDVITKIADESIAAPEDVYAILEDYDKGDTIEVEYIRHENRATTEVELEEGSGYHFRFGEGFAPVPPIPKPPKVEIRKFHRQGDMI